MSHYGAPGADDSVHQCTPDGPLAPGRSVVDAVECNTARFIDLTRDTGDISPTYLVLTDADDPGASLTRTDVCGAPELQNAVAYFGADTDSVRVRTLSDRRVALDEHVSALSERGECDAFEFAGCRFALDVVVG